MNNNQSKQIIANIAGFHLSAEISNDSLEDTNGREFLDEFIKNENCLAVYATLQRSETTGKRISFLNNISTEDEYKKLVVFYKPQPCTLNDENTMSSIQVISLFGSPTAALYHTLQNVFTPLLVQNNRKNTNTSIQRQLINLQAGLRNSVITNTQNFDPLNSLDSLSVYSLEHEVDYWNSAANSAKTKELRASSVAFKDILGPLARDFSVLDALPLNDVEDLLENAHNVLDDLWRHEPSFPKTRIQHLMDLIGSDVERCILKNVKQINIWEADYNNVVDLLSQCTSVAQRWKSTCTELTQIFWPNYSLHAWTGSPYVPQNLVDLKNRLEEILNARTVHRQLIRLLSTSEEGELKTNEMFQPFKELDIFECGPHTESIWRTANKKFECLIEPAEQRVALKLKEQLSIITTISRQLLYEFGRYSELISRPVVKKILLNERQYLLTALNEYVRQLENQLGADVPASFSKFDTPKVISAIMFTRQLETKANDVQKISNQLLDDLKGYEELKQSVAQLSKEVKQQHAELFESWTAEMIERIRTSHLSLKQTDPVVEFDSKKMMHVNYSADFVNLIQEVRQLAALGYRIPSLIEDTSKHAQKFVTHAKILEQIANFHNTIGDRMIPSQRPMMLTSALELAKLVQEQEVVSWGDVESVEKYIESLKQAVEKLSRENNTLTSYHHQIIEKIQLLEDTDLIKYYQKWKEIVKYGRDIVTQVENKGFKSMHSWRQDIDLKLSKILETQYVKSFDSLHLYLPEIHADLIYRDSQLQLSPSEEQLREKYNQQLKRYLDLPKHFRGISDHGDKTVFADIVDRNQEALSNVNTYTEKLFEQLRGVAKHWQTWVSLDALDVSKLHTWEHWDLHFRASKTFGQEIAKLPSTEEKVGCFVIGLSWLRSDLESHNRSYWSQLVNSLKDSIAQDVFKLQQYVDTSTATLHKQPLTLEQIGEADESHADILRQKPEMEELHKEMTRKSQMLASWSRDRVDSVNRLQAAWERLQSLLDNHEHIIAKQIETMKINMNITTENLNNDVERFAAKWEQVKPRPSSGQISEDTLPELHKHLENIREKREQWDKLLERKEKLISDHTRFRMQLPSFDSFGKIQNDLIKEEELWKCFDEFYKDLEKLGDEEWIVFRKKTYRFEEFLSNWQTNLEKSETTALSTRILQEINKYQSILPILKYVRGEDFTEKHWMETFNILQMPTKSLDNLMLKDFLGVSDNLITNSKELQTLCKRSASEVVVRQALIELDQWEVQCKFELITHEDSNKKPIVLIKEFKDILNTIGDNQSLLQSVKNSSDYESFVERAQIWETRLLDLDRYLTGLAQIQRKWMYLEPIFGRGTLGHEKTRFDRLDKDFKHIMKYIEKDPKVTALCRYSNVNALLENILEQLSRCQHSLDEFLIQKRNKFPRFLFLGDDDLLEVVGQSSKEHVIQTHLKKLFAGIHSITLNNNGAIDAICSTEGENVPLSNAINVNQPVENWLNDLVNEMQNSLKTLLLKCLNDGQSVDPLKYPSQILCLADSINFTLKCEKSITSMTLPVLLTNYKTQLNHYSFLELNEDEHSLSSLTLHNDETNLLDLKLKALLLDTIHHIAVIEELILNNVTKITDWTWQKQLRYYSGPSGDVTVNMVNAKMNYSFEYLGNQAKLVRTPLTDKCFLTLTQGMHLGMGGNPYGPAGTGKTESVKALGCLLGRKVLVFNCDEGIDASSMGRILSGLVRCGAWGCFDEFNRLDEATLSAISMHIQQIQNALRMQLNQITLLDQQIDVNRHCGIFVTLNPAGGGYGARNKLPDNLKQLFRPVVMTHPDHEQIARTLLLCDGYRNGVLIGRKLIQVFSLASDLLSKQQHYDWGLRALRTVLSGCARIIRKQTKSSSITLTVDQEFQLVVKALRVDVLSKLTYLDSVKFDGLIRDVFPGVAFQESENESLIESLKASFADLGLQENSRQINKCLELYEQLRQRMGVVVVGPPSSGKTTLCSLLFNALGKMGRKMTKHIFNPKSMPRNQLLGQINIDSRQWSDGVLTLYSLKVTSEPLDVWSWIIADGDIDPEWIESLNSVLDDNRLLCLPSGWRIQFGPNVNFVFETHDLQNASPATISRVGIVFLSEEDVNAKDIIKNFISKQSCESQSSIDQYIQDYFYKGVDWIFNEGEMSINQSRIAVIKTGLTHIENTRTKSQFTVGLINGLGGCLMSDSKELFTQKIFEITNEQPLITSSYYYYNKDRDSIDGFANKIESFDPHQASLSLVLTAKMQFYLDCIKPWLQSDNFLIIGPNGSAKTFLVEYAVRDRSDLELCTIHCTPNLTPQHVIQQLANHCMIVSGTKGRVYKPKKGHLILYFKNMHLLKCDRWGANMIIGFLQQLITYGGLFDPNFDWVGIENVTVIGSLENVNSISIRFASTLHVLYVGLPSEEELNTIFYSYLHHLLEILLSKNSVWTQNKISKLTTTMVSIYSTINQTFSPLQEKHYSFTPCDLTKWCESILRYTIDKSNLEKSILNIICYESLRLFRDKMICESHIKKMETIIASHFQNQWGLSNIIQNLSNTFYITLEQSTYSKSLHKVTTDEWTSLVQNGIKLYERDGEDLNVLIIPELLHLTCAIAKSLTAPEGSVLLMGKAGTGRKSAVKIISALQNSKLITISNSGQPYFNNDLKFAIQKAGLGGEEVYLLFEDHLFKKDYVIDYINTLLCSGEVPGLFNNTELDSLVTGLKDEIERDNFDGNLLQYFTKRVKKHLHIITCLEIDNPNLSLIMQSSPALYQISTVIWVENWCAETLRILPEMLIKTILPKENLENCDDFKKIHELVNSKVSVPSRFVSMVKTYANIYCEKKTGITSKQKKLQVGVSKLTEAKTIVAELKKRAAEQQEKLSEKQGKANAALDMISNTMRNANTQKQEMEVLKQQTEEESVKLAKRKREIEDELAEVKPLIEQARSAVGNIKTEALSEIRSLRAPPDVIRDILEGVLRLMGTQDTSWNSMKNFLARRGVKEDIKCFDARRINAESRQAVERLMTTKSDSFDPKNAKRASVAAAPLAAWVTANVRYSRVLDKIKPLEKEQNSLKRNLNDAENQLEELSTGLTDVDQTVAKLKAQLATYTKEAAEIEIHLGSAQETLNTAEEMVEKLSDEYERWKSQLNNLAEESKNLHINNLLASAFITYLSAESEDERIRNLNEWTSVLNQHQFYLEQFLSMEQEQLQWQSEGLSIDQLSIQNAIIILKCDMYPLLLDPTSRSLKWIQMHLKNKNIEVISQNSPKFNTALELAVRFGKILIIEEAEHISPSLFPILRKEYINQGERKLIKLNGKLMDFHNDFKLIFSCRNTNFKISSDLAAYISIVNFITTRASLTEQLLTVAIKQESPELEHRRRNLLSEREKLQEQLSIFQNQLLEDLVNTSGDILQNKNLMNSLNETKSSSNAISVALVESTQIERKLQKEYEVYKDIASFGSLLFFAVNEFSKTNVLYSLSVPAFIRLFLNSLQGLDSSNDGFMQRHLLQNLYTFVSRGIFKQDRLTFALHLVYKAHPNLIQEKEWQLFIGKSLMGNRPDSSKISGEPSWVPEKSLQSLLLLQTTIPELYKMLQFTDGNLWKPFMGKENCESHFPTHIHISEFQKVLIVQILRPDRLHTTMTQCVLKLTGMSSLSPTVIQLSQIFKESLAAEPILLITTSGTDPSAEIREIASNLIGDDNYIELAMGEGQEEKAIMSLEKAAKKGNWLILKNLHLVTTWLPILSQHIQDFNVDMNFRLWLITEAHQLFNPVLAENSLKIAYEAPQGVKNNLLRTYTQWGKNYIEKLSTSASRVFFAISCFHAILQERRTFIPQGWSKFYEFSDNDLTTAMKLGEEIWTGQNTQGMWKYLSGLCANAIYGGRIESEEDFFILEAYVRQYFCDEILSHRWKPFETKTSLPSYANYDDYVNVIKNLSNRDLPSYFGLPENIDRAWEKYMASQITLQLRDLDFKRPDSHFNLPNEWQKNIAPLLVLWKKLNHGHDFVRMSLPTLKNDESPIKSFLINEYYEAIQLIHKIHFSFSYLNKMCKNIALADERHTIVVNELLNHQTPKIWLKIWNGPKDLVKYLKSVINNTENLSKLNHNENGVNFVKEPITLANLFHPKALLTAIKQNISRVTSTPIDELTIKVNWKGETNNNSIKIKGLLVESGFFDGFNLLPCSATSESLSEAPICYVNWVKEEQLPQNENAFEVPLYYYPNREELLMHLSIPCNVKERDKWIQAGLAFFVSY